MRVVTKEPGGDQRTMAEVTPMEPHMDAEVSMLIMSRTVVHPLKSERCREDSWMLAPIILHHF